MYNSSGVQALVCLPWLLGSPMILFMLDRTNCASLTFYALVQECFIEADSEQHASPARGLFKIHPEGTGATCTHS